MLLYDRYDQWLDYTDPKTMQIFRDRDDAERYASVQPGMWIIRGVRGPYGSHYWQAVRIKPEFRKIVQKEAKQMDKPR